MTLDQELEGHGASRGNAVDTMWAPSQDEGVRRASQPEVADGRSSLGRQGRAASRSDGETAGGGERKALVTRANLRLGETSFSKNERACVTPAPSRDTRQAGFLRSEVLGGSPRRGGWRRKSPSGRRVGQTAGLSPGSASYQRWHLV